ncbi:acyl-CoA synthetase [Aestuariispira insulae]|uniref:3-methylmercaptopropionyl-CoA ligase n=1 Tax=Aestuariispira insulae TaxID=1461337 RepID=A0A3D9H8E8_9PROT|nr:acyl-CoA synthetase [Aestuariispira insulae]RED45770.1 methylmercaptopropionate CoA ligase [Aestuariispira insulae]
MNDEMPVWDYAPTPANHVPLSPLSFLKRTKDVYPDRTALIYGTRRYSWAECYQRCVRLSGALKKHGVGKGDVVSLFAANTPELFEAHFGVPMAGAVLNTINIRLDADTVAYILRHAESKLLITDAGFAATVREALEILGRDDLTVIDIVDGQFGPEESELLGLMEYEAFLDTADEASHWVLPDDEWQTLALNYTSGTSGRPKGVLYHHRGSYLMTMGTVLGWGLSGHPVYLYTVPMFHCNGWGHAWTMAALAGTVVCCRAVTADAIFEAIETHGVTHLGGAPIVLSMLVNAPDHEKRPVRHPVKVMTAGAPPPAAILEKIGALGMEVMQVYGLTETYGHVVQCAWQQEWNDLPATEQAEIKARQGVGFPMNEEVRVVNRDNGLEVPRDGETMGEILIRGNTVMKGYLKNPQATDEAFVGGWFHSGDLAVVHPDGYLEIRDRLKDIIISGGENISSVELEGVLYHHPAVAFAAVVARPDEKWGESPCAFLELKEGETVSEADIIAHCREHLAGFKIPKSVVFCELPKTATGKIQKFMLRDKARSL